MVLFAEMIGGKLGIFVDVLVIGHIVALCYWGYKTYEESQKASRRRANIGKSS